LAHKAQHAIDLETGSIVDVTVQGGRRRVTDEAVAVIEEAVADSGYHSRTTVHDLETVGNPHLHQRNPIAGHNRGSI
jgi:hypothetical protein